MTDTPDPHSSDPQRPGQPPAAPPASNPYAAGPQPTGPGTPPSVGSPGPGSPPAGGLPPTPPNDLPPGPPSGDEPRRFNPLLGLVLVLAIAVLAATQLLGGDDDEGTVPPPPVATAPESTTPAATTPDATTPAATTPEATTPGGAAASGDDDATVDQAKTAVRTLVPLMQDCFARTQDYTQCVEDPAVTGAGITISDEPTPGGVRLKASAPGSFAIVAPDAAGRNWVFKKNAGVPSKRTCEQRGDAPCASKTW